jgi:RNA polymerase sigma-70 factor (ECF subfamily)
MAVPRQVALSERMPIAESARGELERVVREHARFVFKVAYAVLRNHHHAEDAAQETFLRLLRYGKRWHGVRDERAWLARTAWRVALDRKYAVSEMSLEDAAEPVRSLRARDASPEEIAATLEMTQLLEHLVASLPQDLRDVLRLSSVEELTSVEIAQVLGIPEGSVRTRLLRARQLLRQKLESCLEGKHGGEGTHPIR